MIERHFNDLITICRTASRGEFGEHHAPSEEEVRGRFEYFNRLDKNSRGENIVATATVYLPAWKDGEAFDISEEDFIKFNGKRYRVNSIQKPAGDRGNHHLEVLVN